MIPASTTRLARPAAQPRTLVLGLGNPLLADDGVGLRVAQRVRSMLTGRPEIEVAEDYCGGLRLMERLIGFDRAVLIDARCSGGRPGTVCLLALDAAPGRHLASSHDVDLPTAIELGRRAGASLPAIEDIRVVAIEAADVLTFREECTPPVRAAIERAVDAVLSVLSAWDLEYHARGDAASPVEGSRAAPQRPGETASVCRAASR
ncbi:MAG: hydrogenase maturation protease [Phycisphaerae bacterium]